jgi:threonine aldolase
MPIDFRSDNTLGCSPEIIDALKAASSGAVSPYGNDSTTQALRERMREIFETDCEVFPVLTGTAGNCLAIASMSPTWGAVFCHEDAHIQRDEFGAPEFFTSGAKLIALPGADGKLDAGSVARAIEDVGGSGRMATPSCVSLTQATEAGTIYKPDEIRAIADAAHRSGAGVHVDGARFANALVALGCSPADASWRAGVDVLIFGATKNGAMAAEAIVSFRKDLSDVLTKRIHRSGHRLSKMRFLSAQLEGYLSGDVWLRNARAANSAAKVIAEGVHGVKGVEILRPVEANILFLRFAPEMLKGLQERDFLFYDWTIFGPGAVRVVCGFDTKREDAEAFVKAVRELAA